MITSTTASTKVWITSLIDSCTNSVVSRAISYSRPSGKDFLSSASVRRTSSATCNALAPGCW